MGNGLQRSGWKQENTVEVIMIMGSPGISNLVSLELPKHLLCV